uniref:Aminopeptidase n=1 Tax=Plectus sambesii TaxID=2011161 RepID=A0A914WRX9_9BILA
MKTANSGADRRKAHTAAESLGRSAGRRVCDERRLAEDRSTAMRREGALSVVVAQLLLVAYSGWLALAEQLPTTASALQTGSFGGILPADYEVIIRAPLWSGRFPSNEPVFVGSAVVTFYTTENVSTIYLHCKDLSIASDQVRLMDNGRSVPLREVLVDTANKLLVVRPTVALTDAKYYVLHVTNYTGKINPAYGMGIWRGFARSTPQSQAFVIATQFQLDHAREAFPCVDLPQFKADYRLTIDHAPDTIALNNEEVHLSQLLHDGWKRSSFKKTTRLPSYTVGFVILPSLYKTRSRTAVNGMPITLYYNPYNVAETLAATLLEYAEYSFNYYYGLLSKSIALKKLDLVMIPEFIVQGMENFGMITLNERYINAHWPTFQLSLIAHEIAHQWFSNMVTVRSWSATCVQEGITDHYARSVVRRYFGDGSAAWRSYHLDKYLLAMEQETSKAPPENLLLPDDTILMEVSEKCFGKAVFLFDALERLVGPTAFASRVARFLDDFNQRSYDWRDFSSRFADISIDGVRASDIFQYWFEHGGYPSLFVLRDYSEKRSLDLQQKHLFSMGAGMGLSTTSWEWPIPYTVRASNGGVKRATAEMKLLHTGEEKMNTPLESTATDYAIVNDDFDYFYRVNYDLQNWRLLGEELQKRPESFTPVARAQIVGDFCFFYQFGLLPGGDEIRKNMLSFVDANPKLFERQVRYTAPCRRVNRLVT